MPGRTKVVRLAQTVQVGPCIPVGRQLQKAGAGLTSGPTRRLSYLGFRRFASVDSVLLPEPGPPSLRVRPHSSACRFELFYVFNARDFGSPNIRIVLKVYWD
jgi:hypothetical protein